MCFLVAFHDLLIKVFEERSVLQRTVKTAFIDGIIACLTAVLTYISLNLIYVQLNTPAV